jgi:hypothetical protein
MVPTRDAVNMTAVPGGNGSMAGVAFFTSANKNGFRVQAKEPGRPSAKPSRQSALSAKIQRQPPR